MARQKTHPVAPHLISVGQMKSLRPPAEHTRDCDLAVTEIAVSQPETAHPVLGALHQDMNYIVISARKIFSSSRWL